MSATTLPTTAERKAATRTPGTSARIASIDALRGLVMFTMIFVNDLAGVSDRIVPPWMKHYHGKSGMTFVDLVFPAFLFIVGMSIPFALNSRLKQGAPTWQIGWHISLRTLSLLCLGILTVNGQPSTQNLGWSGALWATLMFLAAILAFCTISPPGRESASVARVRSFRLLSTALRLLGFAGLVYLVFAYRGRDGHRIISLSPFSIHTSWYGILGLIGWAYLVGSVVFLLTRGDRTALLGWIVLLMCLYPADKTGAFDGLWLARYVGIGEMWGAHAAITVAGILLATVLTTADRDAVWLRTRFALLFMLGFAAAAWLLTGLYGINKNEATPAWCLWACAITAAFWLGFYFISDVRPLSFIARPFSLAGQNVLLAYLLSDLVPSAIDFVGLDDWYGGLAAPNLACAVARSAGCAAVLLCLTAGLNRLGFRLRL